MTPPRAPRLRGRLYRFGPAAVWMAFIFYMSHQPGGQLGSYLPWFQRLFPAMRDFNWAHLVAYFILALCVYWAMEARLANRWGRLLAIAICAGYGVTDEFHQMFVPDRSADWKDLINDTLGAVAAMAVLSVPRIRRLYKRVRFDNKYK